MSHACLKNVARRRASTTMCGVAACGIAVCPIDVADDAVATQYGSPHL